MREPGREAGQHPAQPQCCRGFHGADLQPAPGRVHVRDGLLGFGQQPGDLAGERQQDLARCSQRHAAGMAAEQLDAQPAFQLADAGGDGGLHDMQPLRRAPDGACPGYGQEHRQIAAFHDAHLFPITQCI